MNVPSNYARPDDATKSRIFHDRSNCARAAKLAAKAIPGVTFEVFGSRTAWWFAAPTADDAAAADDCTAKEETMAKPTKAKKGQTWVTLATEKKAQRAKKVETPEASVAPEAPANGHAPRTGSKYEIILDMLKSEDGATTREVLEATGWPAISMPATARALNIKLRVERGFDAKTNRTVNRYYAAA